MKFIGVSRGKCVEFGNSALFLRNNTFGNPRVLCRVLHRTRGFPSVIYRSTGTCSTHGVQNLAGNGPNKSGKEF